MKKNSIRIDEIYLNLEESDSDLFEKIATILNVPRNEIIDYIVVKHAVDSRNKKRVQLVYSVDVELLDSEKCLSKILLRDSEKALRHHLRLQFPYKYELKKVAFDENRSRPVIVGTGPSGLFAGLLLAKSGLKPILIEQGKKVEDRVKDVNDFFATGELLVKSNVQFGEGGAGTFSDGKLHTVINDPRKKFIFDELIEAGASSEISIDAQPHIGTDRLRVIVKNIRQKIICLGGEVRFETCLTDIEIRNKKIVVAVINGNEKILVDDLVLAIGHSSRDTYRMLYDNKLDMKAKPFSMGVRIEHTAEMINRSQYGDCYQHPRLPTARYRLAAHLKENRSVYSFCMCPGGTVVAAASEEGRLVTNGMSEKAQDGRNSNSALLVSVSPNDFESEHPLAGVKFQRHWEKKAYQSGGGNYKAPAQLVGDFLADRSSKGLKNVLPTYRPGVTLTTLNGCLPYYILDSLREALPIFNQKIKGFASAGAILTGIETRSSSPVRIIRDEAFQSNIKGIYPAGEGAGYAGGIVSAAIDGLKVAEAILMRL